MTDWEESAKFWKDRANAFELALREIESLKQYNRTWEIAFNALKESKKSVIRES